jgi:molybdate transport system ATP-binding protein
MDSLAFNFRLPRRHFTLDVEGGAAGGETLALIGRSGAGKTSVLRVLAGLERPSHGQIALGDEVWLDAARRQFVRAEHRRVGLVPQDYGLLPHLDVRGNVAFGARRRGGRPDLLAQFGIEHLARARPAALSGGERQRVAVARALAREPRVLLLDEPFASLDAITRTSVRDELRLLLAPLAPLALPTVLVTHAFEDAAVLAHRIAVLHEGRVLQASSPAELLARPAHPTVARLLGMTVLAGHATPSEPGCVVEIAGAGQLEAHERHRGSVLVALAPWDLRLTSADDGIAAIVREVHTRPGGWLVDTDRLPVQLPATEPAPPAGSEVHIIAPAEAVHVFGDTQAGGGEARATAGRALSAPGA